jgi:hypothetical protein
MNGFALSPVHESHSATLGPALTESRSNFQQTVPMSLRALGTLQRVTKMGGLPAIKFRELDQVQLVPVLASYGMQLELGPIQQNAEIRSRLIESGGKVSCGNIELVVSLHTDPAQDTTTLVLHSRNRREVDAAAEMIDILCRKLGQHIVSAVGGNEFRSASTSL